MHDIFQDLLTRTYTPFLVHIEKECEAYNLSVVPGGVSPNAHMFPRNSLVHLHVFP